MLRVIFAVLKLQLEMLGEDSFYACKFEDYLALRALFYFGNGKVVGENVFQDFSITYIQGMAILLPKKK